MNWTCVLLNTNSDRFIGASERQLISILAFLPISQTLKATGNSCPQVLLNRVETSALCNSSQYFWARILLTEFDVIRMDFYVHKRPHVRGEMDAFFTSSKHNKKSMWKRHLIIRDCAEAQSSPVPNRWESRLSKDDSSSGWYLYSKARRERQNVVRSENGS